MNASMKMPGSVTPVAQGAGRFDICLAAKPPDGDSRRSPSRRSPLVLRPHRAQAGDIPARSARPLEGNRTYRKPMLLFLLSSSFPFRTAARTFLCSLFHKPPRRTRESLHPRLKNGESCGRCSGVKRWR